MNEIMTKTELTFNQLESEMGPPVSSRTRVGVPLYSIIITKWNEYQSEYLRQKPYREGHRRDDKQADDLDPKPVTQVTSKGEERRREEIKGEEKTEDPPSPNSQYSPLPSVSTSNSSLGGKTVKDEFLEQLRGCPGYPFDERKDSLLFDISIKECPKINIIQQTTKRIKWWKEHPDAFRGDPRKQLSDFFKDRQAYMNRGGPQHIGEVLAAVDDPDHRKWLQGLIGSPQKKREECGY